MQIESIRIRNYKGFADSGEVHFGTGFNVLVGQNNSGKSALLEALRLTDNPAVPHSAVRYERGTPLPPRSEFEVKYLLSGAQFRRAILNAREVHVPTPNSQHRNPEAYVRSIFKKERVEVKFRAVAASGIEQIEHPSFHFDDIPEAHNFVSYNTKLSVNSTLQDFSSFNLQAGQNDTVLNAVHAEAKRRTYVFDAQRLNLGRYTAREESVLSPSAANLPAVLNNLQSNPARYARFCAHVSEVFPNIKWVTVVTVGSEFEIRIWPIEKDLERDDMALSILQGGTGVGQVLAILYVAMTMEHSIIGIDEPGNFLHPGAIKKLLGILNTYATNQYIIATHSTEAITSSDPSTIHLIRWVDGQSIVEKVDISDASTIRATLSEIGANLSDLFGPDAIVWVEGETEQFCFPEICRDRLGGIPIGLSFLALRSTADVERGNKAANKAIELYERVSSLGAIVPPALAFSFDRELRSQKDVADLARRSQRTVVLPRRTLENYLLSPFGIADVLFEELGNRLEGEEVDAWMLANRSRFFAPSGNRWPSDDWIDHVDAPKLLAATFSHLSNDTLEYRKTRHSLMLLKWRLKNEPTEVDGLVEHVNRLIAPPH